MPEHRQNISGDGDSPKPADADGIGKVKIAGRVFELRFEQRRSDQPPVAVDIAARTLTLAEGLPPRQQAEVLAAAVEQVGRMFRIPVIGRVS
ncbi:MAG: hypothetical protein AAGD32_17370 [Planctomycetota bacterium]